MEGLSFEFNLDKTYNIGFVLDLTGTWLLDLRTTKITTIDRKGTNPWIIDSLKKMKSLLLEMMLIKK